MIIGNYIIDDEWKYQSDQFFCYKVILQNNPSWHGILAVYGGYNGRNYFLRIDALYNEYYLMFGRRKCFSSPECAKQKLDLFLNKLSKLAVFL